MQRRKELPRNLRLYILSESVDKPVTMIIPSVYGGREVGREDKDGGRIIMGHLPNMG